MIRKGFRFGMLLQIAVGPVCVFIFQTAIASGFITAESGVLAVVLVDALYILLAILGIGSLLERSGRTKKILQYFGAAVLIIFGFSNTLSIAGISILPSLDFSPDQQSSSVFVKVLFLTLSNPLTILFWAGVFSTRLIEEDLNKQQVYAFGFGAVLATAFFLSLIAILGSLVNIFINDTFITILNGIVGVILIIFGIRTARKII